MSEMTAAEIQKFTDVVTDPRFRLLGFSVADLHEMRRILNTLDTDLAGLALRLGCPKR